MATATYSSSSSLFCRFHDAGGKSSPESHELKLPFLLFFLLKSYFQIYAQCPSSSKVLATHIIKKDHGKEVGDIQLLSLNLYPTLAGKWHPLVRKRWNIDASISRRSEKMPRHLITIGTSDRRWHGKWTCDYIHSLWDLQLLDLVEDEQKDAKVLINLSVEKHASFGLSIDGRITTSFTRKCSNCSSPYCREINTSFNVWVLTSNRVSQATELPEIGGDDPSVIYVKPGYEAHLDQLIQDTLRLTASVKDTCSESCDKSEPTLQYIGGPKAASVDKRWCRLLELKNTSR